MNTQTSKSPHLKTISSFYPRASQLRKSYEAKIKTNSKSLQFWNHKDLYRHYKASAHTFFPEQVFQPWLQRIVEWGQENLGCHQVSPPWISVYTDGCEQRLHRDMPHGPWAFVYSLTPTKKFHGGETFLLKNSITRLGAELEDTNFFENIPPTWNQLTVFDPRLPHGVSSVYGASTFETGRVVLHGWFLPPRPFVRGDYEAEEILPHVFESLNEALPQIPFPDSAYGTFVLRAPILKNGRLGKLKLLSSQVANLETQQYWSSKHFAPVIQKLNLKMKHLRFEGGRSGDLSLPIQLGETFL